jgi:hypothetical protein
VRYVIPLVPGSGEGPGEEWIQDFLTDRGIDISSMTAMQQVEALDDEIKAYLIALEARYLQHLAELAAVGGDPDPLDDE